MPARTVERIHHGWRFHRGDVPLGDQPWWGWLKAGTCNQGGARSRLDDGAWPEVRLPHDFVIDQPFSASSHEGVDHGIPEMWTIGEYHTMRGSIRGEVGWYRRHLDLSAEDAQRRILLVFDGVYRDCRIYVNDFFVKAHVSGYTSFAVDITDFVAFGGENVVAVRVDARAYEGWYYEGGGIYRDVWLVKSGRVGIAPWGVCVRSAVDLARRSAGLTISTEAGNTSDRAATATILSDIRDPAGRVVATVSDVLELHPQETRTCVQQTAIAEALLWSPETPHLYQAVTRVLVDGVCLDETTTTFGIRDIRFDADAGFLLNGRAVKLRGVCCHQDHAGIGVAVPDSIYDMRIRRLQAMGCNAYRTAHHPASPALLDACDRLGMLVMCENRLLSSAEEDLGQLTAMVRRDRNHPSVVIWSLGNEEGRVQAIPQGVRIVRTMRDTVRRLDPTRPVTAGLLLWDWFAKQGRTLEWVQDVADELDVMGFNYSDLAWEEHHARRPRQPMIITESVSGLRTRGVYEDDPARSLLASNSPLMAQVEMVERTVGKLMDLPYISGLFLWTGIDYYGEPVPFPYPATSSQFGVLDLCCRPKDNFHYFRAWWGTEPVLHIAQNWTRPGEEGRLLEVIVYGNAEEVELWCNGASLGRKPMPRHGHASWPGVAYAPGSLRAVGFTGGREVSTALVETTGAPHAIRLLPDRSRLATDDADATVVDVDIVDAAGRVVPYAGNMVSFRYAGPVRRLGVANGDPGSHAPRHADAVAAFNGHCQLVIQATAQAGRIAITATSPGLLAATATIDSVANPGA